MAHLKTYMANNHNLNREDLKLTTIEAVAKIIYCANKAYSESLGDDSFFDWDYISQDHKDSIINGIQYHLYNPDAKPEDSHNNWMQEKLAKDWSYGPFKDDNKKEHPCIVPYEQLPPSQQIKDELFMNILNTFIVR